MDTDDSTPTELERGGIREGRAQPQMLSTLSTLGLGFVSLGLLFSRFSATLQIFLSGFFRAVACCSNGGLGTCAHRRDTFCTSATWTVISAARKQPEYGVWEFED